MRRTLPSRNFCPVCAISALFLLALANTVGYKVKNGTLIHMGFDKRIEPIDEAYRALPDVPLEFMDYTITGNQRVTLRESLLPDIFKMVKALLRPHRNSSRRASSGRLRWRLSITRTRDLRFLRFPAELWPEPTRSAPAPNTRSGRTASLFLPGAASPWKSSLPLRAKNSIRLSRNRE